MILLIEILVQIKLSEEVKTAYNFMRTVIWKWGQYLSSAFMLTSNICFKLDINILVLFFPDCKGRDKLSS